jgi:hypothetical protein
MSGWAGLVATTLPPPVTDIDRGYVVVLKFATRV